MLAGASVTSATTTVENAHGAPNVGKDERKGTEPVGLRVIRVGSCSMPVMEVCGTNIMIHHPIRFEATTVMKYRDGVLVPTAGDESMVCVWEMVKVANSGGVRVIYGNNAYKTSSLMIYAIGERFFGNEDDKSNNEGDDNGPPPCIVSRGSGFTSVISSGGGTDSGGGGGGMAETATTPMLGCTELCINADADAELWGEARTFMHGCSSGSAMVTAVAVDGFCQTFAHGVYMDDVGTD